MKEKLRALKEDGFAVFPSLLAQGKIDDIFRQVDFLLNEALRSQGVDSSQFKSVDAKYLYLKKHHPVIKSHCYDLITHLDSVRSVSTLPAITDFINEALGSPLLLDRTHLRIDDSSDDRLLPFHQEGMGQISFQCITCWLPLVDMKPENGALRYIPGSHKGGYVRHRFYPDMNDYHGIREELIDHSQVKYACLKKGDALIFDPCLFHASTPNKTENIRWTFITRYNSVLDAPYLQDVNAPLQRCQAEN